MSSFLSRLFVSVAVTVALVGFTVTAGAEPQKAAKEQKAANVQKGTKVQGHIVNIKGKNQVIVRTHDHRDVILNINPQTRFLRNNQVVVFTDLREGVPVEVYYDVNGDQFIAGSFALTPAEVVEGEVVRVIVPENRIVIRVAKGQEDIFLTDPQTSFTFDNRVGKLTDFSPGLTVRVHFGMRDQQRFAHSIWTIPKGK